LYATSHLEKGEGEMSHTEGKRQAEEGAGSQQGKGKWWDVARREGEGEGEGEGDEEMAEAAPATGDGAPSGSSGAFSFLADPNKRKTMLLVSLLPYCPPY
jgi:hypothetical protein